MERIMRHSSDILALTGEAAVLVRRGKITFANSTAISILGEGCIGKSVLSAFGSEVAAAQASSFIASALIGEKHYIIRMTKMEDEQLIFFSCPEITPALLNDPFLYFVRGTLMNLSISADRIRELAENAGDKATLENIASLTRSYYRLNRLMANVSLVLDISRGLLQLGASELDLSALCQRLMETVEFFCPNIHFDLSLGDQILCPADPSMVSQLLLNLVSNCLIHAKGCSRIRVNLSEAGDSVILSVSDDGCGIEPGQMHMVFDRYRHGFDMASMTAGTGLGLTAARSIAQLHGGTLLMESRPGHGTSVRASLYRSSPIAQSLRAPQPDTLDYLRLVLMGLADYLPSSSFSEKYMD